MARKKSYITVTDQFCGAGGSSQGAQAAGVEVSLALNHWKLAIETHNTNFPDTLHDCTDISACDPRRYPSTDILITSPECTNHSLAKGQKIAQKQMDLFNTGKLDPAAERSRATMWDVCRFAEYHAYNAIIVENVVDARKWVMFDAWLNAMYALGYNHKCVYLNSMHCHPTPQSRDRMYIVFWKKGNKAPQLDYTPLSYCHKCAGNVNAVQTWKRPDVKFGKYKQQYVYCCSTCSNVVEPYYYAAFNCIDWSDIGTRIGDRNKPLSENTIKRIEYGLKKYGKQHLIITQKYHGETHKHSSKPAYEALRTQVGEQAHGILSPFVYSSSHGGSSKGIHEPLATKTTQESEALVTPFLIDDKQTTGINFRVRSVKDSVNTVHTDPRVKIVMPFITLNEHTKVEPQVRSAGEAIQTQATRQTMGLVTPPIVPILRGTSKARTALHELNGVSAGGIHSGILTTKAWNSFISNYYNGSHCTTHITESAGSVTTKERLALVNYQEPQIEDCYYRMLKPHEIKLAMAFGTDYKVLGSGKDQVKQLGNAVTPPAMQWLVEQVTKSLQ